MIGHPYIINVFDILFVQFLCFTSLISAAVQIEKVSTKSRYNSAVSTARKASLSQPQATAKHASDVARKYKKKFLSERFVQHYNNVAVLFMVSYWEESI